MALRPVGILFCLSSLALAGSAFYGEPLSLPDGSAFCCDKRYASCDESCRASCLGQGSDCQPKPECLPECREAHCQPTHTSCGVTDDSSPVASRAVPAAHSDMSLRYDGQVTGPGTVEFEIGRKGQPQAPLSVYGIVYGRRRDNGRMQVLAKTGTHEVLGGNTTRFQLVVSEQNYRSWSQQFDTLTVAIALPSERDRLVWSYRNQLTQDDAQRAHAGQMRVKGEFIWRQ